MEAIGKCQNYRRYYSTKRLGRSQIWRLPYANHENLDLLIHGKTLGSQKKKLVFFCIRERQDEYIGQRNINYMHILYEKEREETWYGMIAGRTERKERKKTELTNFRGK